MSIRNRLFAKYGHECTIPSPLEDLAMFQANRNILSQIKNILIRWRMASEVNYRTINFMRSQKTLDLEHRRHMKYIYIIHPFSDFRKWWETFMILIFCLQFIMIPLDLCIYKVELDYNYTDTVAWNVCRLCLDIVCLIDVLISFLTGYCDYKANIIVLNPKKIAAHYGYTFFVPDLLSSLPVNIFRIIKIKNSDVTVLLIYLSLLKLLRLITFVKYCKQFAETYGLLDPIYKLLFLIFCYTLYYHIITCVSIFYATRTFGGLKGAELQEARKKMEIDLLSNMKLTYMHMFLRSMLLINNLGYLKISNDEMKTYSMIVWIVSKLIYMILLAISVDILLSKTSSAHSYLKIEDELKGYMKHKQLPVYLQERILNYFEFRFERCFFRESEILNCISGHLKQDIILHSCRKLVENVKFFENLPVPLLVRIVSAMKMEIFLTNDVILKANTVGNCMYFIATGTVAIYSKSGSEVCHLSDGQHFGEVALVIKGQIRIASVVAVEPCELYRLDQSDFINAIMPYPDLLRKIEQIAMTRVQKIASFEEHEHKLNQRNQF